jgi:hypothetical protein
MSYKTPSTDAGNDSVESYRCRGGVEYPTAAFLEHLSAINKIVLESGEFLAGNLFYPPGIQRTNIAALQNNEILPNVRGKRANIINALRGRSKVMEIGFNAGHCALMMLEANPRIRYLGVDICEHKYTKPCSEYLKSRYGDRFDIHFGSSLDVVPQIAHTGICEDIDIVHVDGGHSEEVAFADVRNVSLLPRLPGLRRYTIVDDAEMPKVLRALANLENEGVLRRETLGSTWIGRNNLFFEVMDQQAQQ